MLNSNRHLQRERKPISEDPDIRWVPMTAQDAMALATIAQSTYQDNMPEITRTLRCLAAAYEECYLDVEINE